MSGYILLRLVLSNHDMFPVIIYCPNDTVARRQALLLNCGQYVPDIPLPFTTLVKAINNAMCHIQPRCS